MMNLAILTLFIFPFNLVLSKTLEKDCANLDYTSRFGPIRDQNGIGYCWAFAGTALAEELACLSNPKLCGKSLSVVDSSRCDQGFVAAFDEKISNQTYEGNYIDLAMNCAMKNGLCLEKDAPFYSYSTNFSCQYVWKLISPERICLPLDEIKNKFLSISNTLHQQCLRTGERIEAIQLIENDIKKITQYYSSKEANINMKDIISTYEKSADWDSFLKSFLVPQKCNDNKIKFSSKKIFIETYPEILNDERAQQYKGKSTSPISSRIIERLKNGKSLALGVCLEKVNPFYGLLSGFKCAGHALVVNGARWNKHKQKCEIHLRNSWGAIADFNDWSDLDQISQAVVEMNQFE